MERIPGGTKPRRASADSLEGASGVKGGSFAIYTEWRNTKATSISDSSALPASDAGENFQARSEPLAAAVKGGTLLSTLIFRISPPGPKETSKTTTPSAAVWKGNCTSAAESTAAGLYALRAVS